MRQIRFGILKNNLIKKEKKILRGKLDLEFSETKMSLSRNCCLLTCLWYLQSFPNRRTYPSRHHGYRFEHLKQRETYSSFESNLFRVNWKPFEDCCQIRFATLNFDQTIENNNLSVTPRASFKNENWNVLSFF